MKRTADEFYLFENSLEIKQSFLEVADEIELENFSTIADIGCATGAFPNYLKFRFPSAAVIGIEYLDSLLG
jgi:trans-aconitate methyltransferase